MRRLLAVLSAGLCWGCFVMDELDRGDELMEQLGPGKRGAKTEPAPRDATRSKVSSGLGALERLKDWWSEATEPEAAGSDPDNPIVRCTLGGSVQFMRKSDCQLRGGRTAG